MEILSFDGLRRYWRRRSYQRIDGAGKRQIRVVRLGGNASGGNRRRVWRLRALRKLRLKIFSPVKILRRIRDAYMDAMLNLAGNGVGTFGGKRIPKGRAPAPQIRGLRGPIDVGDLQVYLCFKRVSSFERVSSCSLTGREVNLFGPSSFPDKNAFRVVPFRLR